MVHCIIDSEIDIITANLGSRLANNEINLDTFEYFWFEAIQTLRKNLTFSLVLILKTSAGIVKDCFTVWGKTFSNLKNNIEYNEQAFCNYINNLETDSINKDEMMPLKNNMSQIIDKSL